MSEPQPPPPPALPAAAYVPPYATPVPPKRRGGLLGWVLFIGLAIMLFLLLKQRSASTTDVPMSQFLGDIESGVVTRVQLSDDEVVYDSSTPAGGSFRTQLPPGMGGNWQLIQWIRQQSPTTRISVQGGNLLINILIPLIPWILIFGFIWFFVFRQLRKNTTVVQNALPVYLVQPPQHTQP